jgi:hypothetical protein
MAIIMAIRKRDKAVGMHKARVTVRQVSCTLYLNNMFGIDLNNDTELIVFV